MPEVPIPARLENLPRYHHLPVPWTTPWDGNRPRLGLHDEPKRIQSILERRCGQCGQSLEYNIAFIGGRIDVANRLFAEPGMHQECAQYALAVCPFLANSRYQSGRPLNLDGSSMLVPGLDRPQEPRNGSPMFLYVTTGYQSEVVGQALLVRVAPQISLQAFR